MSNIICFATVSIIVICCELHFVKNTIYFACFSIMITLLIML